MASDAGGQRAQPVSHDLGRRGDHLEAAVDLGLRVRRAGEEALEVEVVEVHAAHLALGLQHAEEARVAGPGLAVLGDRAPRARRTPATWARPG